LLLLLAYSPARRVLRIALDAQLAIGARGARLPHEESEEHEPHCHSKPWIGCGLDLKISDQDTDSVA
jgi:hypothetical protein